MVKSLWFASIASASTAVLVATLLQPTPAAAAPPAVRDVISPIVSPTLKSVAGATPPGDFTELQTDAELQTLAPTVPVPVPLAAKVPASGSLFDVNESRLVTRSETTEIYRNDQGFGTTVVSDAPSSVRRSDGTWTDVSTTISPSLAGLRGVVSHPLQPLFGAEADDKSVFSATRGGYTVSFHLPGAAAKPMTQPKGVLGLTATDEVLYPDVFPSVDLSYQ